MRFTHFFILLAAAWSLTSCAISFKFNGASIDYTTTKSISVADFPNNAALVYPPLSNDLSEGIRDLYQRQTRGCCCGSKLILPAYNDTILTPTGNRRSFFSAQ